MNNQESLCGDGIIQTLKIWPMQHEQPEAEEQPHQPTDKHSGIIPVPYWKQTQLSKYHHQ